MLKIIILSVAILLPISIFSEVTIVNKDSVQYKLFIEKDNSAEHTVINANTTAVACQSNCKILIKQNKNFIKAKDKDIIIIKDGKLKKKLQTKKKSIDKESIIPIKKDVKVESTTKK